MNKSINQIKKELRFIKDNQKAINTYVEAEKYYQDRLNWLNTQRQTQSIQRDITGTKNILDSLKTKLNIKKLQDLEAFYIEKINMLDEEYDKLIIMKVYVQHKTFWQASQELNYSVDGLKDRASRAIPKLRNMINNEKEKG